MEQQIIKPIEINKIADELEKSGNLEMYWDYRDSLTEEQLIKIITDEDYLWEVENELQDYNSSYIYETINSLIDNYETDKNITLNEEEREDLKCECESRFDYNINQLIKQSNINIRVELLSNEDMIYYQDWKKTDTIKYFKERFKGCFKVKDLEKEFNELPNDYALITFYFNVKGLDILTLRGQVLNGKITLRKGLEFGLFNSWVGGGSVLEIPLLKEITLNLDDWRMKDNKEKVIKVLKEGIKESYYRASIKADNISKYSISEVYGLGGFQEF